MTDPIADYLTRLRNAISARHKVVEIPSSNLKKNITKILFDKGYILNYKFVDDKLQGSIKIALKYPRSSGVTCTTRIFDIAPPIVPSLSAGVSAEPEAS